MGSLIIKKVEYSGEKYFFSSPEFTTGINIIKGDNGSGKSTLSFFIEFALGGNIEVFKKNDPTKNKKTIKEEYKHITEDKNNFVLLTVSIDNETFKFKRFIGQNDIFIECINGNVNSYCIDRQHCKKEIFSDWLLDKLEIKKFKLNLGETSWYFNFNDVFRLLYYDQDTELRKIYKKPANDNFVTDSTVIRASIFETLMGNSSDDYFLKMNELNDSKVKRKEAQVLFEEFDKQNPDLKLSLKEINIERDMFLDQMKKLVDSRNIYQKEHIQVDEKFKQLEDKKKELIEFQILDSQTKLKKKNIAIEKARISRLLEKEQNEIESIEKTIFTHEKLNLFDFKICPFCASKNIIKEENKCICGNHIEESSYEKFLYDTGEYNEIIKHKNKSLETIQSALDSYTKQLETFDREIQEIEKNIIELNSFIKKAIESIEYSGNTQITNDIDNKIAKVKDEIFKFSKLRDLYSLKEKYESNFNKKHERYQKRLKELKILENTYKKSHGTIIDNFNIIYKDLMIKSSCKAKTAQIDDEYMPFVDDGVYREKSARVSIRMMYYFTLLTMSLKYKTIKHPKFLLMDTPEDAGSDNITENIGLLDRALELSKNTPNEEIGEYQYILTTGLEKCPVQYEKFVKLDFNKKEEGRYILQERN